MEPVDPEGRRQRQSSLEPAQASGSRRRSPRPASSSRSQGSGSSRKQTGSYDEDSEIVAIEGEHADSSSVSDEDLHDDEEAGLTGKDKRRKRQRRDRNTQLDHRIAPDVITAEEKKEADRNVLKRLLINTTLILLWYIFSLSISLYNKWMFDKGKLNFPFPMFTTSMHMLVQFTLASLVLFLFPSLRPKNGYKSDLGQSRHEAERPLMTKMFYLTRIGPCGMATGLDIGLGNTSLQFITLTFYTMCKSSSLAFVLLFAFAFRLESPTWRLVAIIATMTFGVIMMVAGEVEFHLGGFVLVISAAFFSGFRWALTQILLLRNPATSNPFSSIFFLAPIMFITLFCIAIPVEGFPALIAGLGAISEERGPIITPLLLLFPGTIAFLMTASEFALLKRTSVVTLSIAGIFKEAVTISAAALVFGDRMTPINIVGLIITLCAIAAYNYIKITSMRREAQTDVHRVHVQAEERFSSSSPVRSGNNSDGEIDDDAEDAGLLQRGPEEADGVLFSADERTASPVEAEAGRRGRA
ncbi:triose-phosphate transporter family-domain-containing protein [Cercophora newfieldiana]|uniref:Triose-phosphate transporter family-domain-containing protein n=1 Tax=Cercophora newfieldiana TaxID=92897 RepID=A0AA40D178_9PEZI|nr:triose-phosphate transporter family-domain-containing protein [Cercophora newfieldiana]